MLQPPQPKTKRRIVIGQDPLAEYREEIREELKKACDELNIPSLYRPGIINSSDIALALFTLGVYEQLKDLRNAIKTGQPKRAKRKAKNSSSDICL